MNHKENSTESELKNLISANVKLIQIISYETLRIHAMLIRASKELEKPLFVWNRIEGLKKWNSDEWEFEQVDGDEFENPDNVIDYFNEQNNLVLLLEDFYPDLTEDKPRMIKTFRNIALKDSENKTLVLSQPFLQLPKELEKDVHIIELPYPDFEDIKSIYKKVCREYSIEDNEPDSELIESALGLTIMEAEKAFSLAYIENRQLTGAEVPLVIREKENVIKKSGYLEYYHPTG